jgi:hypothetical protein
MFCRNEEDFLGCESAAQFAITDSPHFPRSLGFKARRVPSYVLDKSVRWYFVPNRKDNLSDHWKEVSTALQRYNMMYQLINLFI